MPTDRTTADVLIDGFCHDFPDLLPPHRIPGLRARLGPMHDAFEIVDQIAYEADLHMEMGP